MKSEYEKKSVTSMKIVYLLKRLSGPQLSRPVWPVCDIIVLQRHSLAESSLTKSLRIENYVINLLYFL